MLDPTIVQAMMADAQQRSGAAHVQVVKTEAVTWRDGSLGCPEPGRMYTQALVKGWRIRIDVGSAQFVYHASAAGRWLWCPPGRAKDPLPGGATE
jgi:hypothetical protein